MTVKKRSKITDDFKSRSWVYETAGTSREHLFTDSEYVQSTGHRISQLRSGDDIGGPFTSRKAYCENLNVGPFTANSGPYHYAGPLFPAVQNWKGDTAVWPSDASASSNYSLDMFGTHAISAVLPTNPVGDAATFLGELREGIPKLIGSSLFKSRLRDLRSVGDEYLNVQFGWKPFVKDLQKFATGVKDHNVILEQLIRDSGRNVRRRYSGAPEVTTVETSRTGIYPQPAQTTALHNGSGTQVTTTRIERKRWFSGAFISLGNWLG